MPEKATELEYLKYFYQNADFGPAHGDVVFNINEYFKKDTGKELPAGYETE
jgi:hypothetical protein